MYMKTNKWPVILWVLEQIPLYTHKKSHYHCFILVDTLAECSIRRPWSCGKNIENSLTVSNLHYHKTNAVINMPVSKLTNELLHAVPPL